MKDKPGTVYLVGAGPGDPGLITVKALDLIQKADVIFYDNLVNPKLLEGAPPKAEKIYVGKRGEGTGSDQKIIEDRITEKAKRGKLVVRLKGGDPFIFGRGGEEAERLAREKIPFEVVPGVTSPIAVPAYAGIPLTHRDFAHTVVFVTGHPKEEVRSSEFGVRGDFSVERLRTLNSEPRTIDWPALAKMGTIVFVMGVKTIEQNMKALREAGRDPETPVAVIRWGTYPKQQTIVGTISTIGETIRKMKLMPPAIIVVGEVVKLREKIAWFESKPLLGRKILVTRARAQSSELVRLLSGLGAEVLEIPTLEISPPSSWKEADRAIARIQKYDWVLFTSVNGVAAFLERLKSSGKDIRDLAPCRLGAVGSVTALSLLGYGLKADVMPEKFTGKSLAKCFSKSTVGGKKILIPRAKEGNEEWVKDLESKGAQVETATVYETRPPALLKEKLKEIFQSSPPDLITFASSSAAKNLVKHISQQYFNKLLKINSICIGPQTEKTVRELGFQVAGVAKKATIEEMVKAVVKCFS